MAHLLFPSGDCTSRHLSLSAAGQPFFRSVARPSLRLFRRAEPQQVEQGAGRAAVVQVVAREKSGFARVEPSPTSKEAHAKLRFQRGSPHKVRRVLDTIRGKSYRTALMILEHLPYRPCEAVQQTMISAANNAQNALGLSKANLMVSECYADQGPIFRRQKGGYKGRAYQRLRPGYHLTIKVKEMAATEPEAVPSPEAAAAAATPASPAPAAA